MRTLLLATMLARYWLTVFPLARRALKRWTEAAAAIPDPGLRRIAQRTLDDEHLNAEGAAIFATVAPWRRTPALVRALVAYQVLYDYLDTLTEEPERGPEDTRHLHRALLDALDPNEACRDWYAHRPAQDDGGYMAALVATCRESLRSLPSYAAVAPSAMRAADLSRHVQALNHDVGADRAQQLRCWARAHSAAQRLLWWECAASASSSLGVHVLAALATVPSMTAGRACQAEQTYCVSLGALNTLLESLVDLPQDQRTGDHSIAGYYSGPAEAAARIRLIATAARVEAELLPGGNRHVVILAGMVGFYLSCAEAWEPHARAASLQTVRAVGYPTEALIVVLRLRRTTVQR